MAVATGIPEAVRGFLDGGTKPLWIDNAYVDGTSDVTITAYNPADGSVLGTVQETSNADVDRAVTSARKALDGEWGTMSPDDRGRILWNISEIVEANLEELATLETLNNGKPIVAARRDDIPNVAAMFRYYAGWATKLQGRQMNASAPTRIVSPGPPGMWPVNAPPATMHASVASAAPAPTSAPARQRTTRPTPTATTRKPIPSSMKPIPPTMSFGTA